MPRLLPELFQSLVRVGCFSKFGFRERIGKQRPYTTPENRVVVDDEDSNHGMTPDCSGDRSGTQAVTLVPFPGALEIFTRPPRMAARSRIPSRPRDLEME